MSPLSRFRRWKVRRATRRYEDKLVRISVERPVRVEQYEFPGRAHPIPGKPQGA